MDFRPSGEVPHPPSVNSSESLSRVDSDDNVVEVMQKLATGLASTIAALRVENDSARIAALCKQGHQFAHDLKKAFTHPRSGCPCC